MDNPKIIWEDDYILALDKPSGWVVNDSNTISKDPVLQYWISKNYDFETSASKEMRSGIVHRLDKPTSGIILVAKTADIFFKLQKQFANRTIEKSYIALVHGKVEKEAGTIDAPVGRLPWNRTKFGVLEGGRNALTNYKVIKRFEDYTLLDLFPKTGRTHQLRIHLQHIGHPIVGDHLYAGRKTSRIDLKKFGRLFLHAKSIEFMHPITGKKIKLEAKLPKELENFSNSI